MPEPGEAESGIKETGSNDNASFAQRQRRGTILATDFFGGVVEWLIAPVLKTGRPKGLVGSNPTPSAMTGGVP